MQLQAVLERAARAARTRSFVVRQIIPRAHSFPAMLLVGGALCVAGARRLSAVAPRLRRGLHASALRASAAASPPAKPPQAAALNIGNEVLSGKIQDTNSVWLARMLYARGVDLVRIEVCPDDKADIARSVRALSDRVGPDGWVFTSGGIGPTHDDVTYEAVAGAFGAPLALHEPTRRKMQAHYDAQGKELNPARLRMATLPAGCVVHETPGAWVPLAQIRNVLILPGVPWLFKLMLDANKELFRGPALSSATLYTHAGEGDLAEALTAVADAHPGVTIGSYPNTQRGDARFTTQLCFDGRDADALAAAVAAARAAIRTFDDLPPAPAPAAKL